MAAPAAAAGVAAAAAVAAPVVQTGDRLKASPYAKKLASEKNVPLNQLAGSGPGGRIVANDVNSYVPSAAAPAAAPVQAAAAAPVSAPAGISEPQNSRTVHLNLSRSWCRRFHRFGSYKYEKDNCISSLRIQKLNSTLLFD